MRVERDGDANEGMTAALCLATLAEALNRREWHPRIARICSGLLRQPELTARRRVEFLLMQELIVDPNEMFGDRYRGRLREARDTARANGFNDLLCRLLIVESEIEADRNPGAALQ